MMQEFCITFKVKKYLFKEKECAFVKILFRDLINHIIYEYDDSFEFNFFTNSYLTIFGEKIKKIEQEWFNQNLSFEIEFIHLDCSKGTKFKCRYDRYLNNIVILKSEITEDQLIYLQNFNFGNRNLRENLDVARDEPQPTNISRSYLSQINEIWKTSQESIKAQEIKIVEKIELPKPNKLKIRKIDI